MASTLKNTTYSKRRDNFRKDSSDEDEEKEKKLIDKFIQASPKFHQ
jgi:hypothetical protein